MIQEEWAGIEGFPDYAVSNHGRVQNLRSGRILSPRHTGDANPRVVLYKEGVRHERYIHRLVASAFLVRVRPFHKLKLAGNREPNIVNIRMVSGFRMGGLNRRPSPARRRMIRLVEDDLIFPSVAAVAEFLHGDRESIYRALRGARKTYKGYTIEYCYGDLDD